MMDEKRMTILYTLKGIQPYTPVGGYVALLLSPLDKIIEPKRSKRPSGTGNIIMGMGKPPMGLTAQDKEDMQEQIQEMMDHFTGRDKKNDEDRDIILIEPEGEYQKRKWNYGDLIEATFIKVDDKVTEKDEEKTEQ